MDDELEVQYDFTCHQENAVGRIYKFSPREGKCYFLRTLLLHVPDATLFSDTRKFEGNIYPAYRETGLRRGLLSDDGE